MKNVSHTPIHLIATKTPPPPRYNIINMGEAEHHPHLQVGDMESTNWGSIANSEVCSPVK